YQTSRTPVSLWPGSGNRNVIVSASPLGPTVFTPARDRSPSSILRTSLLRRLLAAVGAWLTGQGGRRVARLCQLDVHTARRVDHGKGNRAPGEVRGESLGLSTGSHGHGSGAWLACSLGAHPRDTPVCP